MYEAQWNQSTVMDLQLEVDTDIKFSGCAYAIAKE